MALSSEKSLSLVQLVLSDLCKDIALIDYFRKNTNNKQVLNAMIVRLSHLPERTLVDILPNIIYIYRNIKSKEVEKFLYQLCERSQTIYLTIRWAYTAYNEYYIEHDEEYETVLNNMDSAVMNRIKFDETSIQEPQIQLKIQEFVDTKDHQAKRIFLTTQFYSQLTKITSKLKNFPFEERPNQLKLHLEKFYQRYLSAISLKAPKCLPGMYFPIPSESNFIVGIDYDTCEPFSTKERVPYKIVFETVNHDELMKSEKEKQELTKSVFKAINAKLSLEADSQSTKENSENQRLQKEKETAAKLNQYMKNYGELSEEKLQVSYLKSNRRYFDQQWKAKVDKIVEKSVYNQLKSHRVRAFMVKGGDDIRQEFFAMQLIKQTNKIFKEQKLKLWLKVYDVIIFNQNHGFIEFIPDTMTMSKLKKVGESSLKSIYKHLFGDRVDNAIKNFVVSLAGYSIVQYIFQIKDRHNGNIMIDSEGHIIHIDFGFLLGTSPGNMNFEKAPFKLTSDYIELLGGQQSEYFKFFIELLFLGFSFLKGYIREFINLIEAMKEKSDLPCFVYYNEKDIRYRMMENCTDEEIRKRINTMIYNSAYSYYTRHYDRFQWFTNGIYR